MQITSGGDGRAYIYYDPVRKDYTVTEDEFNRLCELGTSNHKEFFLVSISICLPCLINGIGSTELPFVWSFGLFINYLIGLVGLILSIFFGIGWKKEGNKKNDLVAAIKHKPQIPIVVNPTVSTSGQSQPVNMPGENSELEGI